MHDGETEACTHAGAVVYRATADGHEYLVVNSSADIALRVFPKGRIEPGEDHPSTALRELREEAGVKGEVVRHLGDEHSLRFGKRMRIAYFLVAYSHDTAADEDRIVEWLSLDEAVAALSYDDARTVLIRAHAHLHAHIETS